MELSDFIKRVRARSGEQVMRMDSFNSRLKYNWITSAYRRCFYLSQFNIAKLEVFLLDPMKDLRCHIQEYAFPFTNLSSDKLLGN